MAEHARFAVGEAKLTAKGQRWFHTGHPWVYRDDVATSAPGAGGMVRVLGERGQPLGLAAWSDRSRIALRVLERGAAASVGDRMAWFRARIAAAHARRAPLRAETNAVRLVASEADGLPGLIVDAYADIVVLQSLTPFIEEHLDHVVPVLVDLLDPRMVLARNDVKVRELEGLPRRIELCHGTRTDLVEIHEHGLRSVVDVFGGQKTGYFLDQRPARCLAERLARGRVLDLCCYTGGFALHMARGGAEHVVAVDSSAKALAEVDAAAARNGLSAVETRRGKVAAVLEDLVAAGERFDGIVLDPPAFAKSRRDVAAARRGYIDLNRKAMQLLAPDAWLLTCSCSFNLRPAAFVEVLAAAAVRAGRRLLDRGRLAPAIDHPVLVGMPESDYLKVHWLCAADCQNGFGMPE